MRNLVILLSFVFLLGCTNERENQTTTKVATAELTVDGMMCSEGCPKMIKHQLDNLEGVSSVAVNFDDKKVSVEFDDDKVSSEEIVTAVKDLHDGQYEVQEIEVTIEKKTEKKSKTTAKADVDEGSGIVFPNIFDAVTRVYPI